MKTESPINDAYFDGMLKTNPGKKADKFNDCIDENSKLNQAFPDLLAACKIAVKAFEELGITKEQNCHKQALNAIKKAEK